MPRAGRSLELLVQALEQLLAGAPVEIRSPDFIMGRNSGTSREVDVSLRSQVGSVSVLVIIECRDRAKPQDVTWIEQLASKREDVGADKAVAVSAGGFSAGARNLARSNRLTSAPSKSLSRISSTTGLPPRPSTTGRATSTSSTRPFTSARFRQR